jgi:hypothetical protein
VWPTLVLAGKLDGILMRDFATAAGTAAYHARYLDAIAQAPSTDDLPART